MKNFFVVLLIAVRSTDVAAAQERPSRLTVDQAINEAIQDNLGLMAERLNIPIAEAAVLTARLRPNPVLSLSGDHLDLLGTGFNDVNNGGPSEFAWRVDVPVERAHKRELRIETGNYLKSIAEARLADAIRKLKQDVSLACVDVVLAKSDLELARENLKTFQDLVSVNGSRLKAGSIAPLELTRSQVVMLQFRSNVKRAELDLLTAQTKLQNLLGRKAGPEQVDVVGGLKAPFPQGPLELVSLQNLSRQSRPDLSAVRLTQARSQADLKLQIAQGKVDYTWGAEYRRQQGVSGKSNSLGFFLSVPLPIYNRNQGEIARVQAEQAQVGRQIEATQAQVDAEVKTAYQEFTVARDLVESIEGELLTPAQAVRETVGYTYRTGASTLIELLDAQRAFNETMESYYQAQAAYRRAVIGLNTAVGTEVVQQ